MAKQLDRQLGFWSVVSISMGAMLGSGIFVLPGLASRIAGPWVGLSYILAGLMVLPALATKAELATAMPVAGGTYVYVDRAMGPWIGTITGIGTWLSLMSKTAFALVGLGAYVVFLGGEQALPFVRPISLGILGALTVINIIGVGKVSTLQTIIVAICVCALTGFGIWGVSTSDAQSFATAFPKDTSIVAGAAFVFVSYAGVTKVCSIAEEIRDPHKNIPAGMFTAHFTVMVIYAVIATIVVANAPDSMVVDKLTGNLVPELHVTNAPIALVAEEISRRTNVGGGWLGMFMAGISILGLISMSNAGVLSSSRYPFAMGRDGLLPPITARLSSRFSTPIPAIVTTSAVLFLLVAFLPVIKLAKLASAFKLVIFALVNVALIFLRESHAKWYQPTFKAPFYPWLQIAGCLGGIMLLSTISLFAVSGVLLTILGGSVWFLLYVNPRIDRKSVLRHLWGEARILRETLKAEHDEEHPGSAGRVVVPLFGLEESPERLIRLGATLLERGELETLLLEELPEQTMLTGLTETDPQTEHLSQLVEDLGTELRIRTSFHDILTHNAKRAVQEHAEATAADWLVMGWPQTGALSMLVSNPMSWWLDHTPSDLALFWDRGESSFRRILVLAKPGPYDSLVMHVTDRLASANDGTVTLLRPVAASSSQEQIDGHRAYHEELAQMCRANTESMILRSDDHVKLIAELSSDYDLLILGGNPEGMFRTLVFGSAEHKIAEKAGCSVLKVKSPRHKVHPRFVPTPRPDFNFDSLETFSAWAAVEANLEVSKKEDVFRSIGDRIAEVVGLDLGSSIARKLSKRDHRQTTQLPGGVALIGTTKTGLPATTLGIFTTSNPIPWSGPYPDRVDVVIVVASPPGDRQIQLWMLGRLARIILLRDFLSSVRSADSRDDILRALETADGQIDSFYSSVEITQPELPRLVLPEDESPLPDDSSSESD